MELSTFAITIGIIDLLFGLPLVFYPKASRKWLDKFIKEEMLNRVLGSLLVILGALVLLDGYMVGTDPEGIVRLVAWLILFKGLMWAWWPETAMDLKKKWFKKDGYMTFGGLAATAIGVLLLYAGTIL